MDGSTLIVPVRVEALALSQAIAARDEFRWWSFNYVALNHFKTMQPAPFDRFISAPVGVYVHWTLPAALRRGAQNTATGTVDFPLVPNRWLVVRTAGTAARAATAWVIESDCPFVDKVSPQPIDRTALYPVDDKVAAMWAACSKDPIRRAFTPQVAPPRSVPPHPALGAIGTWFDLAAWSERAPEAMFLQAVAPGNPTFAAFVPHCQSVFSFCDDLTGIDDATLSYSVVGWYSDPKQDPAAAADGLAAVLARYNWTLAGGVTGTAQRSLYAGAAFGVAWHRTASPPDPNKPGTVAPDPLETVRHTPHALNVAIGNTTIDAFSALLAQQNTPVQTKLLRAFNYDLLPLLDQANGDSLLDQRIRREWFGSAAAGYRWTIVAQSSDGSAATKLTADETAWLVQLNTDQAALDGALAILFSLQWRLNALWYKRGYLADGANTFPRRPAGSESPTFDTQLAALLDPSNATGVIAMVLTQLGTVKGLAAKVPQPRAGVANTSDALRDGIADFAKSKGLDPGKTLKAVAEERYWQPNNPVVVISGVDSPYDADPNAALTVRLSDQLITAVTAGARTVSRATAASVMPALTGIANLPAGIAAILDELFLLDPANGAALAGASGALRTDVDAALAKHDAASFTGTLPALPLVNWTQPWEPLFMEWRGQFYPIPGDGASANWTFDGTDYAFTGAGSTVNAPPQDTGGIALLSPHAQFVFGSRLEKLLAAFPEKDLGDLYGAIDSVYHWKFLAQELVGFNQWLTGREYRGFRRPQTSETAGSGANAHRHSDLIGYDDGAAAGPEALPPRYRGAVDSAPLIPLALPIPFQPIRQGQFVFSDLVLYDRFGRVLRILTAPGGKTGLFDAKNFPVLPDTPLIPKTRLPQVANYRSAAELPPRVLQHARLDVRLIDHRNNALLLDRDAGVCPVGGWVLPNHLGGSLLIYAPDGTGLGEVRPAFGKDDHGQRVRTVVWLPPPHGNITFDDVTKRAPLLAAMIGNAAFKSEISFTTLLGVIDSTLWTTDPLGDRVDQNLSVLVGRPLALVRMRLQLQLDGLPIRDAGWAATFDTAPPAFLKQRFAIRLGDQATRDDGAIGYFTGDDFGTFNSVAAPDAPPDKAAKRYVQQIGPLGTGDNYLRLSFADGDLAYVTALVDPRASFHATTGILPVKQIDVPAEFVDPVLRKMEIGFRIGPILTPVQDTPVQGATTPAKAIVFPRLAEQGGTWSWWEQTDPDLWKGYDIVAATTAATLGTIPNTLRDGILQLVIDLKRNG